jgi:hypothetical protein
MPVEHGFRPRPIGRPNLARDGVGGGSGNPPGDKKPFTLLPGVTPIGEPIVRARKRLGEQRLTEPAKPTLREEINTYLEERARLRAAGQFTQPEDEPPVITSADAISFDLHDLRFNLGSSASYTPEQWAKWENLSRIIWGFDALVFGLMSQARQNHVTIGYEFGQGFMRNNPEILEESGRLNGEQASILAEQLAKVGLPFKPRPEGITIPFAATVKKMREIAGGEPLWEIPAPGEVPYDISRYRDRRR